MGTPDPRDPDGGVRSGRPLVPGVDEANAVNGTCGSCGATWVGLRGRRTAPGQESWLARLACPGCFAPGQVVVTVAAHSGAEVFLTSSVPWRRRRWLLASPGQQAAALILSMALVAVLVGWLLSR